MLGSLVQTFFTADVLPIKTIADVLYTKFFACVRMETKDAAVRAIIATHGAQIEGYTVKCSWGKEITETQNQQSSSNTSSSSGAQNQVPPPQSVWAILTVFLPCMGSGTVMCLDSVELQLPT